MALRFLKKRKKKKSFNLLIEKTEKDLALNWTEWKGKIEKNYLMIMINLPWKNDYLVAFCYHSALGVSYPYPYLGSH